MSLLIRDGVPRWYVLPCAIGLNAVIFGSIGYMLWHFITKYW